MFRVEKKKERKKEKKKLEKKIIINLIQLERERDGSGTRRESENFFPQEEDGHSW